MPQKKNKKRKKEFDIKEFDIAVWPAGILDPTDRRLCDDLRAALRKLDFSFLDSSFKAWKKKKI